jgi:glycosyltransferase involved in cell wall biosynthesis
VIAHLRGEKDPLRTAQAVRLLPSSSKIRVFHLGKAYSSNWEKMATKESNQNYRYHWLGEVPRWRVRQEYKKTQLMVISSNQEGGANVVSEAIVAQVPIIASKVSGNVGLLGFDYPGYFSAGDHRALVDLLQKAERNSSFLEKLLKHTNSLKSLFSETKEACEWNNLVRKVMKLR